MITLTKSANFKFKVVILSSPKTLLMKKKTLHFGSKLHEDYTTLSAKNAKDAEKRKNLYIARHSKNENWKDIYTKGFWARWLLWNKKTISASIKYIEHKFKVSILYKNSK